MPSKKRNINTGKKGEKIAEKYLILNGYEIKERNYRYKRAEIDLIAIKDNTLIFVEVKTRKSLAYGPPEASIGIRKFTQMELAADEYIHVISWKKDIRFDVIAVILIDSEEIVHIENAF